MKLQYIRHKDQIQMKTDILDSVLENLDMGDHSYEVQSLLMSPEIDNIRLEYDPLESIGNPAVLYKMLGSNKLSHKLGWMKNTIEDVLKRPHFIGSGSDVKEMVKNSALDRLGMISQEFDKLENVDTGINSMLDTYFKRIQNGDYELERLTESQIDAYCESINTETIKGWEELPEPVSGRLKPKEIQRLVFHLNINKSRVPKIRTFKWTKSINALKSLHKYLLDNHYIKEIEFENFKLIFNNIPIEELSDSVVWIDRGKSSELNVGLLVDMIRLLSQDQFIDDEYLSRKRSDPIIQACFRLPDGSTPRLDNKKVTSRKKWPKKVRQFNEFLQNIPSIPSQ